MLFCLMTLSHLLMVDNIKVGVITVNTTDIDMCYQGIRWAEKDGLCKQQDVEVVFEEGCIPEHQTRGTSMAGKMNYVDKVDLFIAPTCADEMEEIARLSHFWNKPIFTRKIRTPRMLERHEYNTTINLSWSTAEGLAKTLMEIYKRLKIQDSAIDTITIIGPTHRNKDHYPLAETIYNFLKDTKLANVSHFALYDEIPQTIGSNEKDHIDRVSSKLLVVAGDFETMDKIETFYLDRFSDQGYVLVLVLSEPVTENERTSVTLMEKFAFVVAPLVTKLKFIESIVGNETMLTPDDASLFVACYMTCYSSKFAHFESFKSGFTNQTIKTSFGEYNFGPNRIVVNSYGILKLPDFDLLLNVSMYTKPCLGLECMDIDTIDEHPDKEYWDHYVELSKDICTWNNSCENYYYYLLLVPFVVLIFAGIVGLYIYRKYKMMLYYMQLYRLRGGDFKILEGRAPKVTEQPTLHTLKRTISKFAIITSKIKKSNGKQQEVTVNRAECIELVQNKKFRMTSIDKRLLLRLRQANHDNLTKFIGVCFNDMDHYYLFYGFVERASLAEFIKCISGTGEQTNMENTGFDTDSSRYPLDEAFLSAFLRDILKALTYLHRSRIGFHGLLTPSNCLIGSNWELKLTKFGVTNRLNHLIGTHVLSKRQGKSMGYQFYKYIAPEHFPEENMTTIYPQGSKSGDIYSFGMILYHLLYLKEPFHELSDTIDLIRSIKSKNKMPEVESYGNDPLKDIMRSCWIRAINGRPDLARIKRTVNSTFVRTQRNLVDQMLKMKEKHAQTLEKLVEARNSSLREAQEVTDRLLHEILPMSIADVLKDGGTVQPRKYESATVLFVDICNFRAIMEQSEAEELIDFLNDAYDVFDTVIRRHDAYKVETTGSTYMVVSGVPTENDGRHVCEIANISLEIRDESYTYKVKHLPNMKIRVKIGFHCGQLAAGVIGIRSPRYCLFGDTVDHTYTKVGKQELKVNFASRMQSTSEAQMIKTSYITADLLREYSDLYRLTALGTSSVKGKGNVKCYKIDRPTDEIEIRKISNSSTATFVVNNKKRSSLSENQLNPE